MTKSDCEEALGAALVLLTMITGEEWNNQKLIGAADALKEQAKLVLVKNGDSVPTAERIVEDRWQAYSSPVPTTQALAEDKAPGTPAVDATPPTREELEIRAAEYASRRNGADSPSSQPS